MIEGGLGSTDMLYYASGSLGMPGAMITASHNPAKYNGIDCAAKAPGRQRGRRGGQLRDSAAQGLPPTHGTPGVIVQRDLLSGYAAHLKKLVNLSAIRPLTVAVDAGNGMAGHTVPKVFEGLPLTVVPLYFELDGTFPNHEANPMRGQPARPAASGDRLRGRHRPGLRRRRGPLLRGGRARPHRLALGADRAHRRPRAGP